MNHGTITIRVDYDERHEVHHLAVTRDNVNHNMAMIAMASVPQALRKLLLDGNTLEHAMARGMVAEKVQMYRMIHGGRVEFLEPDGEDSTTIHTTPEGN